MSGFKRNQIVVYAIVLMLVVAGYLNYIERDNSVEISSKTQNNNIGDATLVSNNETINQATSNETENKNLEDENHEKIEEKKDNNSDDKIEEIKETSASYEDEYFANSKIEREKMYSQMLETYQKILSNSTISEEQKAIATTEIKKINDTKNAIMICENLIEIKGFSEVVLLANGESVNAVIKAKELSEEQIAQVQNIITREMNTEIKNIHIMKK